MHRSPTRQALLLLLALCGPLSASQAHNTPERQAAPDPPDPLDPRASVPATPHRSSLARYRPLADEGVADWQRSNATVGRIGGWRVYLREQAPADTAGAPETGAPPSATPR